MPEKTYMPGEHYQYPLIIKKILTIGLTHAQNQEIVYRDKLRYTYKDLNNRIHRLASGLEQIGVSTGDTVAIFDYDSTRYLNDEFDYAAEEFDENGDWYWVDEYDEYVAHKPDHLYHRPRRGKRNYRKLRFPANPGTDKG